MNRFRHGRRPSADAPRTLKIRAPLLLSAILASAACQVEPELVTDDEVCTAPRALAELPDALSDASGVAISRTHAGVLWLLNNREPTGRVFAVDSAGRVLRSITVAGARNIDWESIAVAACGTAQCLYIAEIGDNLHEREDIGFYRVPEPAPTAAGTAESEWFPVAYPEGPQDAEALFVLPGEEVYIITKGRNRAVSLYRYPPPLRVGVRVELELLQELSDGIVQLPDMVTGADATTDGGVVVVRTYSGAQLYRFRNEVLVPLLEEPGIDLRPLDEPQGEGVAIRDDGWIVLVGERGVNARRAPLGALTCRLGALPE